MKNQTPSELFGGPQDDPKNMEQLAKEISLLSDDQFEANCNILMNVFYKSAPRGRGKIIKPTLKKSEWSEQLTLCKWLKLQYPEVRFRSDIQSAGKLSPQMQNITQILDPFSGWPDIMIFHGRGLGIEMKRKDSGTFLKDGSLSSNKHVQEQNQMHVFLRSIGWEVHFVEGAENAMEIVKEYLNR